MDYVAEAAAMIERGVVPPPLRVLGRMHLVRPTLPVGVPRWYALASRRIRSRALRRLMYRGGIRGRVLRTNYIMARAMLMEFLHRVVEAAWVLADGAGRRTITQRDIRRALRLRYGMRVYS